MADPNQLAVKFKSLPPDQQESLLNELHPDELVQLRDALKSAPGTSHGAGGTWEPGTFRDKVDYYLAPGEVTGPVSALKETGKGILAGIVNPIIHPAQTTESMGATTVATGRTAGGYPSVAPTGNKSVDQTNADLQGQAAQQQLESGAQQRSHPEYALGTFAGPALVGAAAAKLINAPPADVSAGDAAPSRTGIIRKGARIVTQAGERQTERFVKDTIAANQEAEAKAADQTAAQQEAHAGKVSDIQAANQAAGQKHIQQTLDVQRQNAAASEAAARKFALARGVETLSQNLNQGIKDLEQNVRSQANAKYDAVRAKIGDESVPLDDLIEGVNQAKSKLSGSQESIRQFNDILRRQETGDSELGNLRNQVAQDQGRPFSQMTPEQQATVNDLVARISGGEMPENASVPWNDLQGYYSELGEKLSKGNLPGDVYQATKTLQGKVGDLMQKVADAKGVGKDLQDARSYYRDFMATFHEPTGPSGSGSPVAQALRAEDPARTADPFLGKSGARGLEMLAKYSPDLTNVAKTIRDATSEGKGIKPGQPKPLPVRAPLKPTPEAPVPVQPEITKVGPEELQQAKREAVLRKAESLSQSGTWMLPFSIFHGVSAGLSGHFMLALASLGDVPLYMTGRETIVNILEKPAMLDWLSKPSAKDIAILSKLPPEYRTQAAERIGMLTRAATEQNLKVDPSLTAFAATYAGSQPSRKQLLNKGSAIAQP